MPESEEMQREGGETNWSSVDVILFIKSFI